MRVMSSKKQKNKKGRCHDRKYLAGFFRNGLNCICGDVSPFFCSCAGDTPKGCFDDDVAAAAGSSNAGSGLSGKGATMAT